MMEYNHTTPLPVRSPISRRTFLAGSALAATGIGLPRTVEAHATEGGNVPEFQVSHGPSTTYSWHLPKDSPDGTKVLYVTFVGRDDNRLTNPALQPAELWYAGPHGTERTKITDTLAANHVGANEMWIDNERIVHRYNTGGPVQEGGDDHQFIRVVNIDGTVEHIFTEVPDALPIDYHDGLGKILGGRNTALVVDPTIADVRLFDPFTGSQEKILDGYAFTPWKDIIGGEPEEWRIGHRYFNPSGTLIWIKVVTPGGGVGGFGGREHGFSFNLAGEDIVYFDGSIANQTVGGHPMWWDDTRIWHHGTSRIFERDGSVSVSSRQAGQIGHPGVSPNRELLVGESSGGIRCGSACSPVELYLYERGNVQPLETLYSSPHWEVVWGSPDWPHGALAHITPAFSRDGKRVYVNKPVAPNLTRVMMYDVARFARGGKYDR